jgi:hypothetical protein
MINLIPSHVKEDIVYGRRNRLVLRWIIAVLLVIAGVGLMTVFGQFYINKNVHSLEAAAKITQDRISAQNLQSTQQDIQTLSNNFKTVTLLLSKQLIFSKLFIKIGSIIPNGAILSGITLTTNNSSLDLNIIATTRDSATQSFINISDKSNGLFDKADLLSVNCTIKTSGASETDSKYPCTAMIKVSIKTDSSFYFLNSISSGVKK